MSERDANEWGYDGMGEFHDLFMEERHRLLQPALEASFGDLDPEATVLDLGAGTGLGVRTLARATRARIIAVEPSRTMRSVLLARIADDPELVARVTVVAGSTPSVFAQLPARLDGFVCTHVLGNLAPSVRAETFAVLAARLVPGGIGVVTVNAEGPAPSEPTSEERWIGRHRYVARHLPVGTDGKPGSVYEVRDAEGALLRSEWFASDWKRITAEALRAELAPTGWRVSLREDVPTVLMLSREPDRR